MDAIPTTAPGLDVLDPVTKSVIWNKFLSISREMSTIIERSSQNFVTAELHDFCVGLYDASGKWLYATGLPAKSGVGGGILAVCPGKFGIAVVSPPLDAAGNSVKAQKAIAEVSNTLGANPYAPKPATSMQPEAAQSKKKKK